MDVIESAPFVLDLAIVLLLAAAAGYFARKIGLPAIVGYLVVGLLVSPLTPGYATDRDHLTLLADIGVVLLLFEVGIEVDVRRLRRDHGAILWLSPLQVVLTTAAVAGILLAIGLAAMGAVLVGIAVAMSSSVVIVNITRSRRRTTDSGTDSALLTWSVLQDITGVALAAVVLALFGAEGRSVLVSILGLVAFAVIAVIIARLLPWFLSKVRTEHDLFLIVSVGVGLAVASLGTVAFGIPMALAAFVGGLAINGEAEGQEVRRVLLPFRDLFAVLFFVLIGTLVVPSEIPSALPFALLLIGLLIVLKTLPIAGAAKWLGIDARPAQLSVGLSQMGEFAYVLGAIAVAHEALDPSQFVAILLVVMVTITASSVLVRVVRPRRGAAAGH